MVNEHRDDMLAAITNDSNATWATYEELYTALLDPLIAQLEELCAAPSHSSGKRKS